MTRLAGEHHRRRVTRRRELDPAAIEQIDELRTQLRKLAVLQAFHRPRPRHRSVARLELKLHAAVRRYVG